MKLLVVAFLATATVILGQTPGTTDSPSEGGFNNVSEPQPPPNPSPTEPPAEGGKPNDSHPNPTGPPDPDHSGEDKSGGILDSFLNDKLWPYMAIAIFVVTAAMSNVFFHYSPFYELVPESCLLLMFGMVFGGIVYAAGFPIDEFFVLNHDRFFYLMLPPIILESAFQLHAREFFTNLLPIAIYAIAGTVMNAFFVAGLLYLMGNYATAFCLHNEMSFQELLIFSTIIAAVDPVAVLSIFQELKINNPLYFIVFGESLFNDAVVIVMYQVVQEEGVNALDAFGNFIKVFFGAMGVGALVGLLTIAISQFTYKFRDAEPVVAIAMGYLSYVLAEFCGLSGIVSMTIYGLIYSEYVYYNFKKKSNITIFKTVKTLAGISETMIFFLLGVVFFVIDYQWDSAFIFWSVLFCFVSRFLVVIILTPLVNQVHRNRPITIWDQILVSYGGLRGAIAFSLVHMLTSAKRSVMFETTVMFIILFTVFAFGIPTKPLANMLRVKRQGVKSKTPSSLLNNSIIELTVPVIQKYSGFGTRCAGCAQFFEKVNQFLVPWLITGGLEEVRKRQDPFGLKVQTQAPAIDNQLFKELFKPFDPKDFEASQVRKLMAEIAKQAPRDLEITGVSRERQHPSDTIAKAMRAAGRERPQT